MAMFDGVRAVTFDCWGTLIRDRDMAAATALREAAIRRLLGVDEEQARALIREAAAVAAQVLAEPTEFAALGGDRSAVDATLRECPQLAWLRERAIPHFLAVPEPRERTLKTLPYVLYAVEVRNGEGAG